MSHHISLRPAASADRRFLFELHRATMGPYVEELFGPWDDAVQWEFFDRWFHPAAVSVIQVGAHDVGVIGLEDGAGEVYVTRIEIAPRWQNRGIGTEVLERVVSDATAAGKAVALHVFTINPARRLYERLGFVATAQEGDRILLRTRPNP